MFKFIRKHRLFFDILSVVVFVAGSIMYFVVDDEPAKKKLNIFGGVIFALMAIVQLGDIIERHRKKKTEEE